ncbi:MAG: hypothetical protein ACK5GN_00555, partial [Pseudomonadota bacterium]
RLGQLPATLHLLENLYNLLLFVPLLHRFLLLRGNSTPFWYYLGGADHQDLLVFWDELNP